MVFGGAWSGVLEKGKRRGKDCGVRCVSFSHKEATAVRTYNLSFPSTTTDTRW